VHLILVAIFLTGLHRSGRCLLSPILTGLCFAKIATGRDAWPDQEGGGGRRGRGKRGVWGSGVGRAGGRGGGVVQIDTGCLFSCSVPDGSVGCKFVCMFHPGGKGELPSGGSRGVPRVPLKKTLLLLVTGSKSASELVSCL
jgi:hypothetical protein